MINRIRPRLITFDVTGTLLRARLEEYHKIGAQHGLWIEPETLARTFKSNFVRLSKEHPIYGKHTGLGWKKWWKKMVFNIFRDQYASASSDTLDQIAEILIDRFGTRKGWQKYPDTIDLLNSLQKKDVTLGVISNFDQRLEFILEDIQLRQYFTFVLTSYNFGIEKPNLPIFEEALRLAKYYQRHDILPCEVIHIGDQMDDDYFGARNAGWNAALIKREDKSDDNKIPKEDIFTSLKEFGSHYEKIFEANCTAGS